MRRSRRPRPRWHARARLVAAALSAALTAALVVCCLRAQSRVLAATRVADLRSPTTSEQSLRSLQAIPNGVVYVSVRDHATWTQPLERVPTTRPTGYRLSVLPYAPDYWVTTPNQPGQLRCALLGFGWRTDRGASSPPASPNHTLLRVYLPWWLLIAAAGIPALTLIARGLRTARPGHCQTCHYDRSALPRRPCPECGSTAAPAG